MRRMRDSSRTRHMVGTVCGSLALLSAWATATAQTVSKSGARNDSDALVEITVTATKRDESIQAVPTAVTPLTGDEILRQGLVQFTDYMDLVPGLAQNNAGAAAHGLVILRGLGTGAQPAAAAGGFMVEQGTFT